MRILRNETKLKVIKKYLKGTKLHEYSCFILDKCTACNVPAYYIVALCKVNGLFDDTTNIRSKIYKFILEYRNNYEVLKSNKDIMDCVNELLELEEQIKNKEEER